MLFVMFVVSLLVGLTAPRFGAGIDRYETHSQKQNIEDQLRQLPRRARLAARSVELPKDLKLNILGDGEPVLNISLGWTISFDPPLVISRLGSCSGTEVRLQSSNQIEASTRYKITDLSCELIPLTP